MAEGRDEVDAWFRDGHAAVDMETAAVFAVADYFDMDRAALLYVFDTPRHGQHLLDHEVRLNELRAEANERMIGRVLEMVSQSAGR
jgi:nucleoside phosphorylase